MVALLIAAPIVAGCGGSTRALPTAPATGAPASVIRKKEAAPAARLALPLATGTVRLEASPFSDRVRLTNLSVASGVRPSVNGRLRGAIDVSDILVLELQANFYDRQGRLVSSGRHSWHEINAGPQDKVLRFSVRSATAAPTAVAATLSLAQLVNE